MTSQCSLIASELITDSLTSGDVINILHHVSIATRGASRSIKTSTSQIVSIKTPETRGTLPEPIEVSARAIVVRAALMCFLFFAVSLDADGNSVTSCWTARQNTS